MCIYIYTHIYLLGVLRQKKKKNCIPFIFLQDSVNSGFGARQASPRMFCVWSTVFQSMCLVGMSCAMMHTWVRLPLPSALSTASLKDSKHKQKTPIPPHLHSHHREGSVLRVCLCLEFPRVRVSEDGGPASIFLKIADNCDLQ